jgi:hypothetical protein
MVRWMSWQTGKLVGFYVKGPVSASHHDRFRAQPASIVCLVTYPIAVVVDCYWLCQPSSKNQHEHALLLIGVGPSSLSERCCVHISLVSVTILSITALVESPSALRNLPCRPMGV